MDQRLQGALIRKHRHALLLFSAGSCTTVRRIYKVSPDRCARERLAMDRVTRN